MRENIPEEQAQPLRRALRGLASEPLCLEREAAWLVVLSLCDLLMTYVLLRQGAGFYEANPLARWWFVRWNIAGMVAYKFGLIAVVIAICEFVERRRPNAGRAVLWLGCLGALGVFLQGVRLFARYTLL